PSRQSRVGCIAPPGTHHPPGDPRPGRILPARCRTPWPDPRRRLESGRVEVDNPWRPPVGSVARVDLVTSRRTDTEGTTTESPVTHRGGDESILREGWAEVIAWRAIYS